MTDMDLANFYHGHNYFSFSLKRWGKMKFHLHNIKSWSLVSKVGKYSWKFNDETQTLSLFFKKKIFVSFIVKGVSDIGVQSLYAEAVPIRTKELLVIKSKAEYFMPEFKD
jgi:hypothetical protein